MTGRDVPDLTVAELEQIREATLRTYEGGDEQYETLPPHLLKVVEGDGGLIHMIDLAIERTRVLNQLRIDIQQEYAAIHAKQQRDAERIRELEVTLQAGEWVFTATDVAAASLRDSSVISPEAYERMQEAIARARQRRENTNG